MEEGVTLMKELRPKEERHTNGTRADYGAVPQNTAKRKPTAETEASQPRKYTKKRAR